MDCNRFPYPCGGSVSQWEGALEFALCLFAAIGLLRMWSREENQKQRDADAAGFWFFALMALFTLLNTRW